MADNHKKRELPNQKFCRNQLCGKELIRKPKEKLCEFRVRQYCGDKCYHEHQANPNGTPDERRDVSVDAIKKQYQTEIDLLHRELSSVETKDRKEGEKIHYANFIVEQILDAIPKAKPTKEYVPFIDDPKSLSRKTKEQEIVAVFSDWHFGKKIIADEICGLNEFDDAIAIKRIHNIFKGIIRVAELHRNSTPIRKLNIFCLGDLLDGADIYPGQAYYTIQNAVRQIISLRSIMIEEFRYIYSHFEEINIEWQIGNHGEMGRKGGKRSMPLECNFEVILYEMLKQSCAESLPNIHFNNSGGWFTIKEVLGWKFMLTHGANIKQWMAIPRYGLEKAIRQWADMLYKKHGNFDALVVGHFHTAELDVSAGGKDIWMNGSLCGADLYSTSQIAAASPPRQWLWGIDKERIATWMYRLDVMD
jgi:hypothetical protein